MIECTPTPSFFPSKKRNQISPKTIGNTVWCSEIGSLTSLEASNSGASNDRREPISRHQAVEKEIVREVARGDKHNLKKSADRKHKSARRSQSAKRTDLCFAICRFFHGYAQCLSPRATSHTISFSLSNSFGC